MSSRRNIIAVVAAIAAGCALSFIALESPRAPPRLARSDDPQPSPDPPIPRMRTNAGAMRANAGRAPLAPDVGDAVEELSPGRAEISGRLWSKRGVTAPRGVSVALVRDAWFDARSPTSIRCSDEDELDLHLFNLVCESSLVAAHEIIAAGLGEILPSREAETDDNGGFTFSDLPAGSYTIWATAPNTPTALARNISVVNGETRTIDLEAPAAATIRGLALHDPGGAPAEGARITVLDPRTGRRRHTRADAKGAFEVAAVGANQRYYVEAYVDGLLPGAQGDVLPGEDLELWVSAAARVFGVVRDGGAPAAGATVRISSARDSVTTGADGRFSFELVRAGETVLEAWRGEDRGVAVSFTVTPGQTRTIELELVRTCALTVLVEDEDGKPVKDATVDIDLAERITQLEAEREEEYFVEDDEIERDFDADFRGEPEGAIAGAPPDGIFSEAGARTPWSRWKRDLPEVVQRIERERQRDSERPPEKETFQFASTRDDGTVRFEHLEPDRYGVVAGADDGGEFTEEIVIGRSCKPDRLTIRLKGDDIVQGIVRDPEGRAVEGVHLELEPAEMPTERMEVHFSADFGTSAADGRFRFSSVGNGRWTLIAKKSGFLAASLPFDKRDGKLVLEVKLSRGGSISGRVLLVDGQPAHGWTVHARREWEVHAERTHDDDLHHLATTEIDGSFTLTGLAAGTYTLWADTRDPESDTSPAADRELDGARTGSTKTVQAKSGERNVVLRAYGRGSIHGRVRFTGPEPHPEYVVHAHGASRTFAGSATTFALDEAFASNQMITVDAEGYEPARVSVDVPLGGAANVDVVLKRTAAIAGRVLDGDGRALAGATVMILRSNPMRVDEGDPFAMQLAFEPEHVTADREGRFEKPGLAAGEYEIQAELRGYAGARVKRVAVESGETRQLELRLTRAR